MFNFLRELLVIWLLVLSGHLTDLLLRKVQDDSLSMSFLLINVQILVGVMMVMMVKRMSNTKLGLQIFHAFAFLATQRTFRKRVDKVIKYI